MCFFSFSKNLKGIHDTEKVKNYCFEAEQKSKIFRLKLESPNFYKMCHEVPCDNNFRAIEGGWDEAGVVNTVF